MWPSAAAPPARSEPAPRFVSEVVALEIRAGQLEVTGSYRFACRGLRDSFPIFYPFPADSTFRVAQLLSARVSCDGAPDESLAVVCEPRGCHLLLPVAHHDSCRIQIAYRQPLTGSHATYILTSTREWGRPLVSAEFRLRIPRAWSERFHVNYPFRPVGPDGAVARYEFSARQFLPREDLRVEF